MEKKKLPPQMMKRLPNCLKKYDTDKSGFLNEQESSNTCMKTVQKLTRKAGWQVCKREIPRLREDQKPSADTKGAKDVENLMKDSANFYIELVKVAQEVDKDKSATLDIGEVTMLAGILHPIQSPNLHQRRDRRYHEGNGQISI